MSDTRTAILNLAERLIRQKGFHAFSYRDIAQSLKIKNAAIHYHFPSKTDLGVAMIKRTSRLMSEQQATWHSLPPKEKLDKFLNLYQTSCNQQLVCFMGALGPAFEALPPEMQASLREASEEIRSYVRMTLQEGLATSDFRFSGSVEETADLIVSSMLASLILTRVTSEDIFTSVRQAVYQHLEQ